jgi:HAE1 family hydrophobic/amphiphilic exporter-1
MGLERVRQASVLRLNTNLTVQDWFYEEQALRDQLNTLSRELGVPIMVEGAAMQIKAMMHRMGYLLLLSVILIYVILAVQFEHLIYPLIILFSIPCAWFGGLLALWLGQGSLNILSFLSALLLSGLAVNDAILKVDVVKHCLNTQSLNMKSLNMEPLNLDAQRALRITHALAESGRLRFRPVIMTTVTTVLGLIPLLLPTGMGYEFRKPFGLVLIGGMISSTVLTLFLIPLWCKWAYEWGLLKPSHQRNAKVITTPTTNE